MSYLTGSHQWHQQAEEYFLKGNYTQAASIYEEAITIDPEIKSHYYYLGLILLLQEQETEAQTTWLMAMMEGEPEEVATWTIELINILQTEAERQEALEEYTIAVKIRQEIQKIAPEEIHNLLHLVQLFINLKIYKGQDLQELGIIDILQSEPRREVELELLLQTLGAILNYPNLHPTILDFTAACLPYLQNNNIDFLKILLPAILDIGYFQKRPGVAGELCEIYLQLNPYNAEILGHLSTFYHNSGEFQKGIEAAKKFNSLVDNLPDKVFANRQVLRGLLSTFGYEKESNSVNQKHQELLAALIEENPRQLNQTRVARLFNANFFIPYIEDEPRKNRNLQNHLFKLCEANIADYYPEQVEKFSQGHLARKVQKIRHKKIKVGYISHCLRSHSVGWLTRWLVQYHNRDKFQLYGYFINTNPSNDPLHNWYLRQFNQVYKSNDSLEIAEKIYQDEIDILIDLDSITLDISCEVLALKPAPIQITWLGFDAPGSPSVNYFVADPYVLPESAQEYYSERIWRLPQTYIAVDGFEVGVPTISREELNIPSDAIVYLCAQRGFKRHPDMTRLHLKIIKEVPNSYFLIKGLADEKYMENFFYELAAAEGVDLSRLRFLPDVASESVHRANLGIADIVLDTYPYNGATTTLETLWMCIPMVTRVGEQFSARNSYTMMTNAGITEGIAWNDEEYVEWGVRLGKDEALRQQIAWKLRQSRKTSPLWNGKQFAKDMEKAYAQMWEAYLGRKNSPDRVLDKLKILIVTNLYPPQAIGGYERAIADYARLLESRGHTVLVVTSNAEEYTTNYVNNKPEPLIHRCLYLCGEWTNNGPQFLSGEEVTARNVLNHQILVEHLHTFQPDVCLAGNIDFLEIEILEPILADGIPVAHYVMNENPGYASQLAPKTDLYQYITCSDWVRDNLNQKGYPVKTAQTIYPGAAVEEFYQAELPVRDRLRIAYASLVMPYKGAGVLIEALSLLHAANIEFSATIAGGTLKPEFVQALQEFVESEGMQDKVKFAGVLSRQELKELYLTHNVLVFPSCFPEPFGISQIEAMAAGLTLVTSATGGSREIVKHGEDGLIFESENALDLADVLSSLPINPDEWERIAYAGQKRTVSELTQTRAVEQLEEVLFKLASITDSRL